MAISCILLSAGSSSRFGSPKALAKIDAQTTVIEHIQRGLIASKVDEVIPVLGDSFEEVKPYILNHKKIKIAYNKDFLLGQTSSFKAGLKEVSPKAAGVMLLPVDVPFVKSSTIDALVDEFIHEKRALLIPSYHGRKGHPPIFSCRFIKELLALKDSEGINAFQLRRQDEIFLFPVLDAGVSLSFNTQKEFEEVKSKATRSIILK